MDFFAQNRSLGQSVIPRDGTAGIKISTKQPGPGGGTQQVGGYWPNDGDFRTLSDLLRRALSASRGFEIVRRSACLIFAAVVAWLIIAVPVDAAKGEAPIPIHAYTGTDHSATATLATTERGPPATHGWRTACDVVDRCSHGSSARPNRPESGAPGVEPGVGSVGEAFHAIVTDLVGAPSRLVGPDRSTVWSRSALLWGEPGRVGDLMPLRFPGQFADAETGLVYNVFRYYDPVNARFISSDPLGQVPGPNTYAYVSNPTTLTDPLGLSPCGDAATTAGKQIDAVCGGLSNYKHGGQMTAIEHINYGHASTSGFTGVSRFAEETRVRQIAGYVDNALRYGTVTPNGTNGSKVIHDTGSVIGTDPTGRAVTGIQIYVRKSEIQTAFLLDVP
ncbi:RHS repeat-associated core domain-containing protein [Knoellia sp. DB2414S]|uniref:RHS repeat-associated core domain-containing protein n=2 Tax=Knoellia koreensis TaxID=2730921 RepID=A0A849HDV6_9MICO|nr:RHS repeat-associated core domain-containing protein [Knoellia sp. DB2414S]NNM44391.1 RHS repeat-associated core domain-containing protein [Knoellia sp. DB2414S]